MTIGIIYLNVSVAINYHRYKPPMLRYYCDPEFRNPEFKTGRSGHIVQTHLRYCSFEQSDLGLHCLLQNLHLWCHYFIVEI